MARPTGRCVSLANTDGGSVWRPKSNAKPSSSPPRMPAQGARTFTWRLSKIPCLPGRPADESPARACVDRPTRRARRGPARSDAGPSQNSTPPPISG